MIATTSQPVESHQTKGPLAIVALYRPFIVGLLIVLASTYGLVSFRSASETTNAHQVMNAFMGSFFVVFAVPKLFNLNAFAGVFRQYDVISKRFTAYARLFPFVELTLGLALLSGISARSMLLYRAVNLAVAAVSGIGIVSVMQSLRSKKELDCACMGTAFKFPLSKVAIAENGLMFVMALGMLITMQPEHMTMASVVYMRMAS